MNRFTLRQELLGTEHGIHYYLTHAFKSHDNLTPKLLKEHIPHLYCI